jgi:hypothetical protein
VFINYFIIRRNTPKVVSIDLLALVALVGAVAWFCEGVLFERKIPFFRDLLTYSYPINFSISKSFLAGELPLWDRHMAAGFPLLAAFQPGVFYPPTLLFYLLPFFDAIRWTFLVHFLIAAFGAYFLCRRWKCPIHLSLIGAVLFAFGGTIVSLSNLLNHFQSAVWLPWMILCGERFLHAASWQSFVLLIFVLLCALLAGSPEIYIFSIGLVLIHGITLSVCDGKQSLPRVLLSLLAANVVVAALGMVQFLPTLELLLQSRRDQPIPFHEATLWSLNPISLIGLFLPDKEADSSLSLGVRLFFARDVPFLLSHYLGVLSLLGISAWGYFSTWKERVLVLVIILASLTLALGNFTPVYQFLYEQILPFRIIRFPEKYFFITYVLLLYVVVKGLAALHQLKDSERKFPVFVLFALLMGWAAVYSLCRLYPETLSRSMVYLSSGQAASASAATTVASVIFNLERQIGVTVALLLVFFCASKRLLRAALQPVFLVLIVLFDLGATHKPLLFPLATDTVTKSDRILPHSGVEGGRIFYYRTGGNLHPSSLTVLGWPSFPKAVALSFENLLPNAGVLYGFDYFQEIDALTRQPYNDFLKFANLLPPEKRIKLLRALNIRYVVAFEPLDISGMRLSRQFPEHFSWLYEIDRPVPRVYITSHAAYEPQTAKTLRILSSPDFDPLKQVLLNEKISREMNRSSGGEAKIVRYSNNNVVIDASLDGFGILVLTDTFYPGWKVRVDGKESRILQANYFFRGVELSAGSHRIEFVYDPLSFQIGLIISLLTIVFMIAVPLAGAIWRRRLLKKSTRIVSHQPARAPVG